MTMETSTTTTTQGQGQAFTASQIAAALGVSARAVRMRLEGVPESGSLPGTRFPTKLWLISALPQDLQQELAALAGKLGFRDAGAMLRCGETVWQPEVPWSELDDHCKEDASRWQAALEAPIRQRHKLSPGDLAELGRREYRLSFGREIGAEHWGRVFKRALERDGGRENWSRVEIYLGEQLARRRDDGGPDDARFMAMHEPLRERLQEAEDKGNPTSRGRAYVWHHALAHYEGLLAAHQDPGDRDAIKRTLAAFLLQEVPALAAHSEAMRRTFNRMHARWVAGGSTMEAVADKRPAASGQRRPDFAKPLLKIAAVAVQHDGNVSLAHRMLRQRGELPEDFEQRYAFDARQDKSAVPKAVREAVTPIVNAMQAIHRGPHQARAAGPYIARDWNDTAPGDWFEADDVTWNHYFWFVNDEGEPEITRGECLVMVDRRSMYPLGFTLIPGRYNARWIRRLVLLVHDDPCLGLPHKGFVFENGIWAAKMVVGEGTEPWMETRSALESCGLAVLRERETGLNDPALGVEVRHALPCNARSKVIERTFLAFQETMRSEPGYVGPDEKKVKFEAIQKIIGQVKRGSLHPAEHFLSLDQWCERIKAHL